MEGIFDSIDLFESFNWYLSTAAVLLDSIFRWVRNNLLCQGRAGEVRWESRSPALTVVLLGTQRDWEPDRTLDSGQCPCWLTEPRGCPVLGQCELGSSSYCSEGLWNKNREGLSTTQWQSTCLIHMWNPGFVSTTTKIN